MERKRGQVIAIAVALVVAIVSLGVAFAAFSTTLTINGTATVQATTWKLFFTSASNGSEPSSATALPSANITPTGTAASTTATLNSTTFTWAATFKSPGDQIKYKFYVRNTGDYDAKVKTVTKPAISCTNDTKNVCSHISYGIYTDSGCSTAVAANQTIAAKTGYQEYYLCATLDSTYGGNDGSSLASSNITTNAITATILYEQSGTAK